MARRLFRGRAFSENGWPYVDQGSCRWVKIAADATIQIQDGVPATILAAFARDYDAYVEPIFDADCACWTLDNSVDTSNHPGGTAMDLRWQSHPFQRRGSFTAAQLATIQELLDFYEDMVFWAGIDWSEGGWGSPIDEMHWQMGYGTYDRANDRPFQKCFDFISRKIRADGYSTFRRGGSGSNGGSDAAAVLAQATGLSIARAAEILPTMRDGLKQADCTNVKRIAMFAAQTGHESDDFNATEEYADGPMDQERWIYKGRTWIQVTWRDHYARFGQWCFDRGLVSDPNVFVTNPSSLADLRWAGLGAAWYWTVERPQINSLCDAGDIVGVTQAINGGQNGIADRRTRYTRALAVGDALLQLLTPGEDDFLSALTPDEQRKLYDEIMKSGPSRSFFAPDHNLIETLLGFIYNTDGNVWTITLTLGYLFDAPYAVDAVERIARDGVHPDSWAFGQLDEHGERWLAEFGQSYCQGLVKFKKKITDLLEPYGGN